MYGLCGCGKTSKEGSINFKLNVFKAFRALLVRSELFNHFLFQTWSLGGQAIIKKYLTNRLNTLHACKNDFICGLSVGKTAALIAPKFSEKACKGPGMRICSRYIAFFQKEWRLGSLKVTPVWSSCVSSSMMSLTCWQLFLKNECIIYKQETSFNPFQKKRYSTCVGK